MPRYLMRWATWWHHAVGLKIKDLLYCWISIAAGGFPAAVWVGADCYWQLVFSIAPSSKA